MPRTSGARLGAALAVACGVACSTTFIGAWRRMPAVHKVERWAESDTELMVPPMTEAPIFLTPVDVVTGELDVSSLPEEMGVYAVYDGDERLQYIGLSRNMQKSVATHAKAIGIKEVGDLIGSVRCAEMPDGSKEELKSTWEVWLKDHLGNGGEIPVGNLPENAPGADPRWRSKGAQAKPSLNLGGVAGIASQAEAMDAVRQAVEENPIVLFMKGTPAMPQCGFSARTSGLLREIGWQPTTQQCKQIVDNCSERYEPAFSRHVVRDRDRIWGRDPAWGCFSHTHLRVVVPRPLRPELTFHSVLCFPAWTCGWAWSGFFCPHSHLVSGQRRGCTRSHADFYLITGDSRQNASFPFLEQALTWFPSLR
ncbi:Bifunctional monothiol glutaredoxin-S16 [Durusdinium trenchii]|uniref:Chloroplastic (AtGrxS16) (Atypical GIY-YIG endonuclease) (CAX-interacting protein 2) (CAXIP1-like protein) n=1 Tax=Durusdinium trenchii TaxID=1381693 RepID=A0ABP0ME63_9DINO